MSNFSIICNIICGVLWGMSTGLTIGKDGIDKWINGILAIGFTGLAIAGVLGK